MEFYVHFPWTSPRLRSGSWSFRSAVPALALLMIPLASSGDHGSRSAPNLPFSQPIAFISQSSTTNSPQPPFSRKAIGDFEDAASENGMRTRIRPRECDECLTSSVGRDKRMRTSATGSSVSSGDSVTSGATGTGARGSSGNGSAARNREELHCPNPDDSQSVATTRRVHEGRQVMSMLSELREVRRRLCARNGAGGAKVDAAFDRLDTDVALKTSRSSAAQDGTPTRSAGKDRSRPSGQWQSSLDSFRSKLSSSPHVAAAAIANTAAASNGQNNGAASGTEYAVEDCVVCGEVYPKRKHPLALGHLEQLSAQWDQTLSESAEGTLTATMVGRIDCASKHVFCYECIYRWGSTCENSCPLCKQAFTTIEKLVLAPLDMLAGRRLGDRTSTDQGQNVVVMWGKKWKIAGNSSVEEKRQRPDDEDAGDEEGCIECSRPGLIIYCDSCDGGYCLECAGLTYENIPPEEDPWYCEECGQERSQPARQLRNSNQRQRRRRSTRRQARILGRQYRVRRRRRGRRQQGDQDSIEEFLSQDGCGDEEEDSSWVPPDEVARLESAEEASQGEWGPRLRSSRVPRAIPMPRSARFPRSAREHQGQNEEQRETSPGACRANVDSRAEGELRARTAEETLASRREFRGQNSPESAAASYRRARPGVRRPGLSRNISRDHQIRLPRARLGEDDSDDEWQPPRGDAELDEVDKESSVTISSIETSSALTSE